LFDILDVTVATTGEGPQRIKYTVQVGSESRSEILHLDLGAIDAEVLAAAQALLRIVRVAAQAEIRSWLT